MPVKTQVTSPSVIRNFKGEIGKPRVGFSEKLPEIDVDAVKDSAEDLLKDLKSIFR